VREASYRRSRQVRESLGEQGVPEFEIKRPEDLAQLTGSLPDDPSRGGVAEEMAHRPMMQQRHQRFRVPLAEH
jgi:hypothetical protein